MKKLLTLLALLGTAAVTSAQVTFTYDSGDNNDTWNMLLPPENVTIDNAVWRANQNKGAYVILKASSATYIQGYTIELGPKDNSNTGMPYSWTLEGSNDKGTWTTIHTQTQANRVKEDEDAGLFASNSKAYTYYCNTSTQYEYYKLTVNGKYGGNWGCFEIARFGLIPSSVGFAPTASNAMMDGNTGSKVDGNASEILPYSITVSSTAATRISGFQLTTGDDNASYNGRNPRNIKIEGSTDNINWTTIQSLENYTGMGDKNYYPYVFKCDGVQVYQYYKLTFDNISANWFQLSEIAIITPQQISTPAYLTNFASLVNNGSTGIDAVLTTDIDLTDVSWTPIGNSTNKYSGTFNGQGHTVTLAIDNASNNQGLFGVVQGGATIQNVVVAGSVTANAKVAGLIGMADGGGTITLSKVINKANIQSTGSTDANAAGFVGCAINNTVVVATNCGNTGSVSGQNGQCAAFTGWAQNNGDTKTTYTNCWNSGTISNMESNCNLYRNTGSVSIDNCYDASGNDSYTQGTLLPASSVASGELCYKLGVAFTQNLSAANYPTFGSKTVNAGKWFNNSENDVYYNEEGGNYTVYQLNLNEENTVYSVPANVTAKNVSVDRSIPADQWIGLCLPFDYTIPSGWDVRELDHVEGSGESANMIFSTASSIVAGKPYIVKPTAEVTSITATDKEIATEAQTEKEGEVSMVGSFAKSSIPVGSFYINTSSQIKKLTGSPVDMKGFRAYFTVDGGSGVKELNFDFDDDATAIEMVAGQSSMANGTIYNVAGQRISKMQKGINIVNGKKVLF